MHKDAVHAGQAAYTPFTLSLYDKAVLGVSCRWLWRCPASRLLGHYQANITDNHLDVGVGSGYFLDKVRFPSSSPRLALMDLNTDSLAFCARRVARYQPDVLQRNVLTPIDFDGPRFDSLAMNLLFHCLPGSLPEKVVALDHLLPLLNPGARVFGATLLQGDVSRSLPAKGLMSLYNAKGIFSNRDDSVVALRETLASRLDDVHVEVQGCAGLFHGRVRKTLP